MPPKTSPSISRTVKGLPRYYMDCGWWRHPRFAGLSPDALFAFSAIISYCTEHATDGRAPAHPEDLAAAIGMRASAVKRALKLLSEREIVIVKNDQIEVRNWSEHNPTSAEIEAYNEARSKGGNLGNHKRWHERRGVVDPECEHCDRSVQRSVSDRSSDHRTIAVGSHGLGWDGNTSSSPPTTPIAQAAKPPDDGASGDEEDQPQNPTALADQAVDLMAQADLLHARESGTPIRQPDRWLATARDNRYQAHYADLLAMATQRPEANPADLAEELDPTTGHLDGGAARARAEWQRTQAAGRELQARGERGQAWLAEAERILGDMSPEQLSTLEAQASEITGSAGGTLHRIQMRLLALPPEEHE